MLDHGTETKNEVMGDLWPRVCEKCGVAVSAKDIARAGASYAQPSYTCESCGYYHSFAYRIDGKDWK